MSILEWGREVLSQEASALGYTRDKLGDSFIAAVECMLAKPGKIIVTGLGKSGHVARKIAATLASTGSSSFFVHPSEALHGDSGMIQAGDCLIAIAYSGETPEVVQLAEMSKRLRLPIVAITGNTKSSLAAVADIVLDGSIVAEADPLNIVPTSSSTVALALGDALAIALMRHRGFSEEDFGKLHPGGSLGKKLSRVSEYVRVPKFLFIGKEESFSAILEKTSSENFGIIGVQDNQQLVGAISDGDLRRSILKHGQEVFGYTAAQLMTSSPKVISADALVAEALSVMEAHKITSIYVSDAQNKDKVIGLIRMHDLVSAKIL